MLMKNVLCFIMGYLVAMETYVTLFLSKHFLQGIWYRCDQCVYGLAYVMAARDSSDRYFHHQLLQTTRGLFYGSNSGFHDFGDLDL